MMRIDSSNRHITLDIVRNFVPLDDSIAILNDQHPFSVVLINLVMADRGVGHSLNSDPCLVVETDHMVVYYCAVVVFTLDQDPIHPVSSNTHILANYGSAEILLVRTASNPITFAFLNLIQRNVWKGAVDLNPFVILHNDVPRYLRLTRQTYLNPDFVLVYAVTNYARLELFPN